MSILSESEEHQYRRYRSFVGCGCAVLFISVILFVLGAYTAVWGAAALLWRRVLGG